MKVFIDDIREPYGEGETIGWSVCRDAETARHFLRAAVDSGLTLECVSFDNDLGEDKNGQPLEEGREVLNWLEERVIMEGWSWPQEIRVHTANSTARDYMERILKARGYTFSGAINFNGGADHARIWKRR